MEKPPAGITERGMEFLLNERMEAIDELGRLDGFLYSVSHR
ncbi:polymorphic toxin type 28 domain-containing protein [Streptomyces canus]